MMMERISNKKSDNKARNFFSVFDPKKKGFLSLNEIFKVVDEVFSLNYPFESSEEIKGKLERLINLIIFN